MFESDVIIPWTEFASSPSKILWKCRGVWKLECSVRNDSTPLWRKRLIHHVLTDNVYRLELIHPVDFHWKSWFSDSINKLLLSDWLWSFNLLGSKLGTFCNRIEHISQKLQWAQKSVFEGISFLIKVRGHILITLALLRVG